jgi:hypothetical protein
MNRIHCDPLQQWGHIRGYWDKAKAEEMAQTAIDAFRADDACLPTSHVIESPAFDYEGRQLYIPTVQLYLGPDNYGQGRVIWGDEKPLGILSNPHGEGRYIAIAQGLLESFNLGEVTFVLGAHAEKLLLWEEREERPMAESNRTDGVCVGDCGYKGPGRQEDGRCPTCGSELIPLPPGRRPPSPDPPNTIRCPSCRELQFRDFSFCGWCGTRLRAPGP